MGESPRVIPCSDVVSGIRMRKYLSTAALVAALICTSLPLAAATPSEFYANLLRRGVAAYDGGRFEEAARSLRFAAFGYVDAIEPYQTAHAYLALAHDRLGESDRARESVRRILNAERIERRFARLALPAPVRSAFDKLASTILSAPELAALRGTGDVPPAPATQTPVRTTTTPTQTTPSTNTATRPAQQQPAQQQPAQQQPAQQQPARQQPVVSTTVTERTAPPVTVDRVDVEVTREPATPTQQPRNTTTTTTTNPPAQQQPARTTPAPATQQPVRETATTQPRPPTTTPAPAQQQPARTTPAPTQQQPRVTTTTPRPATYSATELATRFSSAERALVSANLNEARRLYREILASANGTDHATALRVAEGLYRARDFAGTISAFERAGALRRGEEPYRYYQAVAFYETGQYERARRELAAVLPYIEVTPDVERYRLKIQGGGQ